MKIKTKKQLNLPQLIEWAWENPELSQYKMFEKIGSTMRDYVSFNNEENGVRLNGTVKPTDTFTVEVEEEITEDTPLPMVIECDEDLSFWVFEDITLKNLHEYRCVKETTKYYRDTDENMHLIWRDGKLVD